MNIFDCIKLFNKSVELTAVMIARDKFDLFEDANPEKHPTTNWSVWKEQCTAAYEEDIDSLLHDVRETVYNLCESREDIVDDFEKLLRKYIDSMNLSNRECREKYYAIYNIKTNPEE